MGGTGLDGLQQAHIVPRLRQPKEDAGESE